LTVPQWEATPSEAQIDAWITDARKRHTTFVEAPADTPVAQGMRVKLDLTVTVGSGTPNTVEDSFVVDGSVLLPDIEAALIGQVAGTPLDVHTTTPPDRNKAPESVHCKGSLVAVETPVLPELDDAFATQLGAENADALRSFAAQQLQKQLDRKADLKARKALFDMLDTRYVFDVPPSLLAQEKQKVAEEMRREAEQNGEDTEDPVSVEALSSRRARLSFLLLAVVEARNITISDDDLRTYMQENNALSSALLRFLQSESDIKNFLEYMRRQALEDRIVRALLADVVRTPVAITGEALLQADVSEEEDA
jgi:trigger factor